MAPRYTSSVTSQFGDILSEDGCHNRHCRKPKNHDIAKIEFLDMIADQPKKSVGNCGQDSARNKQQSTHYYQVAIVAQVPQELLEASYIVSYKGKTRDSPQKQSKVQA